MSRKTEVNEGNCTRQNDIEMKVKFTIFICMIHSFKSIDPYFLQLQCKASTDTKWFPFPMLMFDHQCTMYSNYEWYKL